jgi:hypothetical protein
MKIGVKVVLNPVLSRRLTNELGEFSEEVIAIARDVASKFTPRRSGAAARAWTVEGRGILSRTENKKPYIEKLEQGSSNQAPRGILKPTVQEIRRRRLSRK